MFEEQYENLANAIILRALLDLKRASKKYLKGEDLVVANNTIHSVLVFLYSDYYKSLTGVNPNTLVRRVLENVEVWRKKQLSR